MAMLAASAVSVCACSQTEQPEPVVITRIVQTEIPPEARKVCPALSPKPDRDLPEAEVFSKWAADRNARNVCEFRRAAAVAAADAKGGPQ